MGEVTPGLFDYRLDPQPGDTVVVWFSNGAASAIAWQETLRRYGNLCDVRAVNNPVAEEDPDNLRFAEAVSSWLDQPLIKCLNPDYPLASAVDVWSRRGAMVFPNGAPCTVHLKKQARQHYEKNNRVDWHVLGFTVDEKERYDRFTLTERSNVLPVLIEAGLTKQDCFDRLVSAGIQPPRIYASKMHSATLWPTPSARDWRSESASPEFHAAWAANPKGKTLPMTIQLWATPKASEKPQSAVPTQVALYPTPTSLAPARNGNNEAGNSAGLVAIRRIGLEKLGPSEPTEKPGALNPAFVCWLMGFPPAWESCAPTAMPSSRKSRRK